LLQSFYLMKQPNNSLVSRGVYFDLAPIFADLNRRFFNEGISAYLKWGRHRKHLDLRKKSIRLGSYNPYSRLIIIHPCLDQAMVPTICLERILFHEMLHQRFPSKKSATGKNLVHYREFLDFEKSYPYLNEADRWLKANLARLLRY
jgi:hypothetical protein